MIKSILKFIHDSNAIIIIMPTIIIILTLVIFFSKSKLHNIKPKTQFQKDYSIAMPKLYACKKLYDAGKTEESRDCLISIHDFLEKTADESSIGDTDGQQNIDANNMVVLYTNIGTLIMIKESTN